MRDAEGRCGESLSCAVFIWLQVSLAWLNGLRHLTGEVYDLLPPCHPTDTSFRWTQDSESYDALIRRRRRRISKAFPLGFRVEDGVGLAWLRKLAGLICASLHRLTCAVVGPCSRSQAGGNVRLAEGGEAGRVGGAGGFPCRNPRFQRATKLPVPQVGRQKISLSRTLSRTEIYIY